MKTIENDTLQILERKFIERNLRKDGSCLIWTGKVGKKGYGYVKLNRETYYLAHRVSYAIEYGDPYPYQVNHSCDNPTCVNIKHLHLGTPKSNMQECSDRGRMWNQGERVLEIRDIKRRRWIKHDMIVDTTISQRQSQ